MQPSWLLQANLLPRDGLRLLDDEALHGLGWPGLDPSVPTIDILIVDDSASLSAVGGNDPIGNRYEEAKRAIAVVQRWTLTRRPKVAVLHFDQPSSGDSGVVTLRDADSTARLGATLKVPRDGRGTSFLEPSLIEAGRLADAHPDHHRRLTILSDFEIFDEDPAGVFSRMAVFPGEVHAVVLQAEPPIDLAAPNITITRLQRDDPPGALAAAVHRSLTATRRGRRLSPKHEWRTRPSIPPL